MEEIKIYLNKERKNEVQEEITFEKVVAGEISRKTIYIENIIKYPINIKITLEGENIQITKNIDSLYPKTIEEVEFEFTPELTAMKPITAELTIKLDYVIR